jgi:hypothetical protein
MIVTEPIFTQVKEIRQPFLENSYTEFYRNTTKALVSDIKLLISSPYKAHFFYFVKYT